MNRRQLLAGFAATASGLLLPEPVRAYSFVGGWRESEYERVMRAAHEAIRRAIMGNVFVMPPSVEIECIGSPEELMREKRLTMRVKICPINWTHVVHLLSEGFEFA